MAEGQAKTKRYGMQHVYMNLILIICFLSKCSKILF